MAGLPYVGWSYTVMSKQVTARNNEFAAIETEIMKMDFDSQCSFNGYRAGQNAPINNKFPCIQRENIRIVSNPYRAGLTYFLVEADDTPVRWRGLVDYPIPFNLQQERKLLSPQSVRRAFLTPRAVALGNPPSGR